MRKHSAKMAKCGGVSGSGIRMQQGGDGDRSGATAQSLEPGDAFGGGNDLLGNLHGSGRWSGKHGARITCAYEE